jgi:electron transport complex protein RnfC
MTRALAPGDEQPCIRCGDCATVCPVGLHPQRLLLQLRDGHVLAMRDDRALDCTECGRCEAACPSRIPLVRRYQDARQAIQAWSEGRVTALAARERYRERQERLGRDEDARIERQSERAASATSADAVAAAIARAQARRAAARKEPGT